MEGFKTLAKGVKCYKEGGSVYKSRHSEKREMSEDIAQDKKIVKKAFAMHDKQEHHGEKTDLSKLKKGGRAKKAQGTVKKYKTGGSVTNVYEAKKSSGDLSNIQKTKQIKPTKAAASSAPIDKLKNTPMAFKKGGKVKKYADGSSVIKEGLDAAKSFGRDIKNNIMGTPEQNRIAQEQMDKQAREGSKLAKFLGGKADAESAPVAKKCGGKVKKYGVGGKIEKIASGLFPSALFGAPTAAAIYSNEKAKDKKAEEEATKDKEADAKSAPVAKCSGGRMKRGGKVC